MYAWTAGFHGKKKNAPGAYTSDEIMEVDSDMKRFIDLLPDAARPRDAGRPTD